MPQFSFFIIIVILILCIFLNPPVCDSLRFELQSGSTKCISEEIKHNAMTLGTYKVINPAEGLPLPDSHRIKARVTSPKGNKYHYDDAVETGTFAFTAPQTGNYMTCFSAPYHSPPVNVAVEFEWQSGVDARDWYNIARKGQIELLDVELKRLYDTVRSIHDEMFYLREREEEMQQLNTSTKSKMTFFSFCSVIIVMSVAALQIWHLKGYFERKKLL